MKLKDGDLVKRVMTRRFGTFWDGVSAEEMNSSPVRKTREDEMEERRKRNIGVKVLIEERIRRAEEKPTGSRWTDINEGDDESSECRSRLAA